MKARNLFIEKDDMADAECPYVLIGSHDPADGMDGAVAHVFGDDESAAEKLAREILDGLSVACGGESGVLEVNEYQLMGGGPDDVVDLRIERRRHPNGYSKWVVVERGVILNKSGGWQMRSIFDSVFSGHGLGAWEQMPDDCYFGTPEEALRCWQTAVVRSVYDKNDPTSKPGETAVCHWADNDDYWETDCGTHWSFVADGPAENGMKYCHSCGRPLHVDTAVVRSVYDKPVEEAEERPSEEVVRDILLLVREQEVDLGFLANLADGELTRVAHWASLTYYAASDNDDVEVPPMPHCLAAYFSPSGLGTGG